MAYLEEVASFKEQLFLDLTEDEMLVRAIVNPQENFSIYTYEGKPKDYMYKNFFPYNWIDNSIEKEKKSYITVETADFGLSGQNYKDLSLAIHIFVHQDIMRVQDPENSMRYLNRLDYVCARVDRAINQSRNYGIGQLQFSGMRAQRMSAEIPGQMLVYRTTTFNTKDKELEKIRKENEN